MQSGSIYTIDDMFNMWKYTVYYAKKNIIPVPHPLLHKSYIRDNRNNTIAMILAKNGCQIPPHWEHWEYLTNSDGDTVAMIYA